MAALTPVFQDTAMWKRLDATISAWEGTPYLHGGTWRGRGTDGRQVRSGIYLCRLRAGGTVSSQKMILVR